MSGFEERIEKIRALIEARELESIVLRRNPNLAWAIAGRSHVATTIDSACFDLIVTRDSITAVTNIIEAPRLIAEEFVPEIGVKIIDWWENRDSLLPVGVKVGCDQPGFNRIDLGTEIEILRATLVADDIKRFRIICSDAAIALGRAMREVSSSDREIDVAGKITKVLWESNLEISFLGVAGDSRVKSFRHPLPTTSLIGTRAVASICAKRKGLIASLTRIVTFGEVSESDHHNYMSLLNVEAELLNATVVGNAFSQPIKAVVDAYSANGFDVGEWKLHHQGGPTGYLPRDWPATISSTRLIAQNQPIAWNPTGKGLKVEDTVLTTADGLEILSVDFTWPAVKSAGRLRPGLLQR